ncbi:MAG: lipid A export permease/ATP-binding protein MsbA [Gammaproteobacteria bacterium]|nr:lipid A export permease/ATP-binding protein MsbA [Gammaproteobacteria bacterium]
MDRPTTTRELYFSLLRYVVPYWKVFAGALASIIVLAMTEPAIPALMKPLLDGSFIEKDPGTIRLIPLLLILLFLVRGLSNYASQVALGWVSGKVIKDLRSEMFNRLLTLPCSYYDANPTGTIISRITFNVEQVASAATNALLILVRDSLSVIGLLAWMIYLNWKLSMIFIIVVPAIGIVIKLVSGRLRRLSTFLQQAMGDMTHIIDEAIKGNRVVKLFSGQDYEGKRFDTMANRVRHMNIKIIATSAANVPIVQMIAVLALAFIIYIASSPSMGDEFTVGGFISFFGAMGLLFSPIKRLTKVNEQIQRGLAASESIFELLAEPQERDKGTTRLRQAQGNIEFNNVSMHYDSAKVPALNDINLQVRPGETVALVGRSGSGKSSLAALVPRFYQPSSGQVLLDGIDLQQLSLGDLRANIALVNQDIVLFNDSVAANIAYGAMREAGRDDIIAAAEAAHAMEFINGLPEGLDTLIGENGARLSGGQRQRLAIARALLKNAPVLVLDEATSALDTESERHVHTALETLKSGRTSIIIAHRLSTIEHADRIVVLEDGCIVETGTHQELLDKGGVYQRLHSTQLQT